MVSWTGSLPHVRLNGTCFQAQNIQLSTTESSAEYKRHFQFLRFPATLFLSPALPHTQAWKLKPTQADSLLPFSRPFSTCTVYKLAPRKTCCITLGHNWPWNTWFGYAIISTGATGQGSKIPLYWYCSWWWWWRSEILPVNISICISCWLVIASLHPVLLKSQRSWRWCQPFGCVESS